MKAEVNRIRWEKYDTDLYCNVVPELLGTGILDLSSTALDTDLLIRTDAVAEAASPIRRKKIRKKSYLERESFCSRKSQQGSTLCLDQEEIMSKDARKFMRQALRMALCYQKQDLLVEIMIARDCDVKLFHKLIRRHQTIPNIANQMLILEGVALTVDGDIAAGFASHFESFASSLENKELDVDHLFDATVGGGLQTDLRIDRAH